MSYIYITFLSTSICKGPAFICFTYSIESKVIDFTIHAINNEGNLK